MIATLTTTIAHNIRQEDILDPRVFAVIEKISDCEILYRITENMACGLDTEDDLLISGWLNIHYPPADQYDVAQCLGHGVFTVILNSTTNRLEWESDAARHDAALKWMSGNKAFGFTPPERILVKALTFDGTYIRYVENPTEEMMLTAVRRTSSAIEYIQYPSDAVMQAAATRDIEERAQASAALSRKYGADAVPDKATVKNVTPSPGTQDIYVDAAQGVPTYIVQGIGSLNNFSGILLSLVIKLNHCAGNDERHPGFTAVTEMDGGLVLSFGIIQQLFLLRDMFCEAVEMTNLNGEHGLDFDSMVVVEYPSSMGPGFVRWEQAAVVVLAAADRALH